MPLLPTAATSSTPRLSAYAIASRMIALSPKLPIEMLMTLAPASTAFTMPSANTKLLEFPASSATRMEKISAPGATPGVNASSPAMSEATAVPWPFQSAKFSGIATNSSERISPRNAPCAETPVSSTATITPLPQSARSPSIPNHSSTAPPSATAPDCTPPSGNPGITTGKTNDSFSEPSSSRSKSARSANPTRKARRASSREMIRNFPAARSRKRAMPAASLKISTRSPSSAPSSLAARSPIASLFRGATFVLGNPSTSTNSLGRP